MQGTHGTDQTKGDVRLTDRFREPSSKDLALPAGRQEEGTENIPPDCWRVVGIAGDGTCGELEGFIHCRNCPVYSRLGRSLLDRPPPPGYRTEWTSLLAKASREETSREVSVVVFRIGGEWFALRSRCFEEIVTLRSIHTIPHCSNSVLLGLVNVRGELLLCMSLHQLLGLEEASRPQTRQEPLETRRMAVVRDGDSRWVLELDEVDRTYRFPLSELEPVPETVARSHESYSCGIRDLAGKRVALLDERLLFNALNRSTRWQAAT